MRFLLTLPPHLNLSYFAVKIFIVCKRALRFSRIYSLNFFNVALHSVIQTQPTRFCRDLLSHILALYKRDCIKASRLSNLTWLKLSKKKSRRVNFNSWDFHHFLLPFSPPSYRFTPATSSSSLKMNFFLAHFLLLPCWCAFKFFFAFISGVFSSFFFACIS